MKIIYTSDVHSNLCLRIKFTQPADAEIGDAAADAVAPISGEMLSCGCDAVALAVNFAKAHHFRQILGTLHKDELKEIMRNPPPAPRSTPLPQCNFHRYTRIHILVERATNIMQTF